MEASKLALNHSGEKSRAADLRERMSLFASNTTYTDALCSQGAFELMMYSSLYDCDLWLLS